jgi:predicted MPP superfamily phosphohydrolase
VSPPDEPVDRRLSWHPAIRRDRRIGTTINVMPRSNAVNKGRYRRARIRNFLFSVGPNRLTGGRVRRRHLGQETVAREIDVASPAWPSAFDGLRIGHISDFHLGSLHPLEHAMEAVEQLRRLEPDFVACTGDVVDLHHDEAPPLLAALAGIRAPLGVAMVLGNHDELHCADTLTQMAEAAGIVMLRDEAISMSRAGSDLVVAGINWCKTTTACRRHIDRACGDGAHLLLSHNPKAFLHAARLEIALTLSGHTHGGQVAMKKRRNLNLAFSHRRSAGVFQRGPSRLYVTTGVGAWFPLRVNCPAEVAVITMKRGEG